MKKVLGVGVILLIMLLGACGQRGAEPAENDQEDKQTDRIEDVSTEPEEEEVVDTEDVEEAESEETEEEVDAEIDTSMYEYAEDIEVIDALEINDQITLIIDMPESNTQGTAFQNVLNHTYDFLQQDSAKEAKTIGINIRQGGNKIAMFTVHPDEFKTDDDDDIAMADLVLDVSVVNMALPEVEEYAKNMDMKLNKE